MNFQEVMDIDTSDELKNRTWWWWFWLFFFKPDEGEKWKQLMILWGTRNCKRLRINDMEWKNERGLKRNGQKLEVPGLTAAWYFDGKKMHDPLFLESGTISSQWSDQNSSLVLKNGGHCSFSSNKTDFRIDTEFRDMKIDLEVTEWLPHLHDLVPTGKRYLGFLGYKMVKLRGCRVKGILDLGKGAEKVEGTTYFQKVRINSPTSPWYFGVFHSARGDYIDYFMPHIGPPMLRRSASHKSKLDFWEKILSKGVHFVEANGRKHNIKNIHLTKAYDNGLPVFYLSGAEKGKKLEMELRPYSRAYWRVEQPLMGFLNTVLYYNEYPAFIEKFRFEENGRVVTHDDMGYSIGNCEHAWGIV
jgi:hypothetical protein